MLETIRELALEKLEPLEDSEQLRRRHADYMLEFLKTSDLAPTDAALAQRMKAESDNLRTAVEWALSRQHADLALSLAGHSYHGPHPAELSRITAREWTGWLDAGLALADRDDSKVYADALIMRAAIHRAFGDDDRAEPLARGSLDRFFALGDRVGQSRALLQLGLIAMRRGEHDLARERFEQALELAEAAGSAIDHRHMLHNLGELERAAGNLDRAAALLERALQLARDAGASWHVAMIEHSLGDTALASGDMATAERHYMRALSLARDLGYLRGIEVCLAALASLAAKRGQAEHAGRLWGASEAFQRAVGYELHPLEWHVYEEAIATVAGPQFEEAAKATRNAEPDEALAAALAE
jgi:tetratricopeptide (TPR) repeat protein